MLDLPAISLPISAFSLPTFSFSTLPLTTTAKPRPSVATPSPAKETVAEKVGPYGLGVYQRKPFLEVDDRFPVTGSYFSGFSS